MPAVLMAGPTPALAQFYGQGVPLTPTTLPAAVMVTNIADIPPTSVTRKLTDQVTITQTLYDPATRLLLLTATSSDKQVPPQLFAVGLPGSLTGSEPLTGGSLTYTVPSAVPPIPPATVTVISAAGGQDTAAVTTSQGGTFTPGAPVAVDDTVEVPAGTQTISIPVLANDSNADTTAVTATQVLVHLATQPKQGTAVVQADQSVLYTPTNQAVVGEDTFTYNSRHHQPPVQCGDRHGHHHPAGGRAGSHCHERWALRGACEYLAGTQCGLVARQ
jgi:hypothetical protein